MSRSWDVDGIEWEDLPTVSDLLCAADTKILAREIALPWLWRWRAQPKARPPQGQKAAEDRPRAQRQDCPVAQACHQS